MRQPLEKLTTGYSKKNNKELDYDKECLLVCGIIILYNVSCIVIMIALVNSESSKN
tara:strand:+ start:919 stop:1086 length:168 start_codon:yes stop_codon:yes gene_type:complete